MQTTVLNQVMDTMCHGGGLSAAGYRQYTRVVTKRMMHHQLLLGSKCVLIVRVNSFPGINSHAGAEIGRATLR